MRVAISGQLPTGHGADAIFDELVKHPDRDQFIVASVRCSKITTVANTGEVTASVRFTAIEAMGPDTVGWQTARDLLERQREYRTGEVPLPLNE